MIHHGIEADGSGRESGSRSTVSHPSEEVGLYFYFSVVRLTLLQEPPTTRLAPVDVALLLHSVLGQVLFPIFTTSFSNCRWRKRFNPERDLVPRVVSTMADQRADSEAPSSSSSDFYASDPPAADQPVKELPEADADAAMARAHEPEPDAPKHTAMPLSEGVNAGSEENNDEDSGSEMDCSSPSVTSSPTLQPATAISASAAETVIHHAGSKRKLSDIVDANTTPTLVAPEDPAKKRKLVISALPVDPPGTPPRTARLPAEVWQRVFMHLSPAMLCRCLRVSKPFNMYLTHLVATPAPRVTKRDQTKARIVDSESIWIHARKTYFTTMPRPLAAFTELDMLKLVGGRTCQFCNRTPVQSPATSLFNAGPGPNGLRVIWPFGIRSCGSCLEMRILKVSLDWSRLSLLTGRTLIPLGHPSTLRTFPCPTPTGHSLRIPIS